MNEVAVSNLNSVTSQIDPDLWETLSLLREIMKKANRLPCPPEKSMDCLFDLCCCILCIHIILSDFIEASGGSVELITVLNRLGAVASVETPNRHIMKFSAKWLEGGLLKQLKRDMFTVATKDNIDFLQSNAAVYADSQHRSWHGTNVQIVQPQQVLKS